MKSLQQHMSVAAAVAAILGGVALTSYAPTAQAQSASDEISEVVVTGSRIVRKDLTSNSPLVTVDTAALEQRAGLNIESYLNQLPAFNPAAAPTILQGSGSNSDVQISAVSSVGISAISLRGFGANRSLTLVDGRRQVPNNALMVVDVNGIPTSMIKRVEIISGGASAVYGADAIGGVSNFILRKDFEGLELDGQYGAADVGDNQEIRASAIMGTKIADGKGHMVFATEYYQRQPAYEKNRDFWTKAWADPYTQGNFLGFVFGANGYNALANPPNPATVNALFGYAPTDRNKTCSYAATVTCNNLSLRFNPDGSLFDPGGSNAGSFKRPIDNYIYSTVYGLDTSLQNPQGVTGFVPLVKYDEVNQYASSPQTRYAAMASGEFAITDHIKFFSDARFNNSKTKTFLAGTNASFGWEATIPYNPATDSPVNPNLNYKDPLVVAAVMANPTAAAYVNPGFIAHGAAGAQHPVPVQMAIALNSRTDNPNTPANEQTAGWVLETYPLDSFGRRATIDEVQAFQIETGVSFDIPVKDWTGEVYYSRGESTTYNVAEGNNSLARWRGMVQSNDYGYNTSLQSNSGGANPNFGSVPVHCSSGFYNTVFLGDQRPSDDCLYAVGASLQTRTENQQDIVEFNTQGGLFNLPAGEVRAAAGYQFRRNSAQFNPDILQSTASFNDQVIGVYPTGYLDATTSVHDYYGELLVPVIGGFSWLKKVELDLGGRQSDYNKTKDTFTWKANANIEINDAFRLRGGFNRATRAPNLGEMFLNLQQVFGAGGNFGDPCGPLSNSPFGAGGAIANPYATGGPSKIAGGQTAAGANSTYLICRAQMGATAANYFYSGANTLPPAGAPAPGGFAWNNQQGNPNLRSETANTVTAGFVFQSPWDNAWAKSISFTADYYRIKIKDAIEPYTVDYARYLCYGTVTVTDAAGAAAQAASPACQNVPRSTGATGGGALTQLLAYSNLGTVNTSGVDFALNWFGNLNDLGIPKIPGGIGLNIQGTWLDYYKTKASPTTFDPEIDWRGSLGPQLAGFNGGAYSYRLFSSLSYTLPTMSVSLRWRYLPKVDVYQRAQENAIRKNNAAAAAGDTSKILLSYTPVTYDKVSAYSMFDLGFNWNVTSTYSIRAGVDNLFDRDPPTTGRQFGYLPGADLGTPGTNIGGPCAGAPGCQNPTTYSSYALTTASDGQGITNGGYYDTLGRRYYVGFKAQF